MTMRRTPGGGDGATHHRKACDQGGNAAEHNHEHSEAATHLLWCCWSPLSLFCFLVFLIQFLFHHSNEYEHLPKKHKQQSLYRISEKCSGVV